MTTDIADQPITIPGFWCRLKNRRIFVGRAPDGSVILRFKRLRTEKDAPGPRTIVTPLALSTEALDALIHTYHHLQRHEDQERAKKMPTTYAVDVTAVGDFMRWTADHEKGIG
jgi:hypothetical protein